MVKKLAILCVSVAFIAVLFLAAGTTSWWNAWVFIGYMILLGAATQRLIKNSPGLEEERRTAAAGAKKWDIQLVRLINMALPVMLLVSACDTRFHWLPSVPVFVSVLAFILIIPSAYLTYRAMAANLFFSSHVRIQKERGHVVVDAGPYGIIRHPGYAGSIVFNLLTPLALGSWSAFVFGIGTAALLTYRTVKEDRVLVAELPGYCDYSQKVRYLLVPGMF
jgi:protein-S-isoprenylcysteine O-methyltransferase Ste14